MAGFREEQRFAGPLRFIEMVTEVDDRWLQVRLSSILKPASRQVARSEIRAVEAHADLSKHVPGSLRLWLIGIRVVPWIGAAINPGTRTGVTVHLMNGRRLVLGSRRHEELARILRGPA